MKIIAVLFIAIIISSCGNDAKKKTTTEPETIINNADSSVDSISKNKNIDSTTKIILKPGSDTFTEASSVDAGEQKIISITIASGQQLFATLHKKNKRFNVRINQIEMPDSTFDGPFGDSLHYKIKMPGIYKIRIGPDLMADGSRNGEFIFKAWVK
ncbi:MAG: hypothetical protein M3139_13740 [Bacteroidota bacterium]|nr:hypothetical protein [Bacteroidota bacterium]